MGLSQLAMALSVILAIPTIECTIRGNNSLSLRARRRMGLINKVPASQPAQQGFALTARLFQAEKINSPIMIRPLASCQRLEWSPP